MTGIRTVRIFKWKHENIPLAGYLGSPNLFPSVVEYP